MITKEQIIKLTQDKLQGSHLFLVGVKVSTSNKIEVFIDGDAGIAISDCVNLSRFIEKSLDREAEDFSLEVSSPGATVPLTMGRQYLKHIGRDLEVLLNDGTTVLGTLVNITLNGVQEIVLETTSRQPKPIGKGKITVTEQHKLNLNNIKESKIKLKF